MTSEGFVFLMVESASLSRLQWPSLSCKSLDFSRTTPALNALQIAANTFYFCTQASVSGIKELSVRCSTRFVKQKATEVILKKRRFGPQSTIFETSEQSYKKSRKSLPKAKGFTATNKHRNKGEWAGGGAGRDSRLPWRPWG